MGKSDLLKDGMKGGLNGLISSTTSVKSEEKRLLKRLSRKNRLYTVTSSSTRAFTNA